MERRRDVHAVVSEKRGLLGELSEIRVAPAEVEADVRKIARENREADLSRKAGRVDNTAETDVVHPELQRVAGSNGSAGASEPGPNHSHSKLLNRCEIRRVHTRIGCVGDVPARARDVAQTRRRNRSV